MRSIIPGQIYKHFKGNLYQVITVAHHSETDELLVVYQKLYEDYSVCARPYDMFLSEVDKKKYPDAKQKYRFELIDNLGIAAFCKGAASPVSGEIDTEPQAASPVSGEIVAEPADSAGNNSKHDESQPSSMDIRVLNFIESDSLKEKANILKSLYGELTNRMIDDMAASMDVVIDPSDDIDKRFKSLLYCIETKAKYEVKR